MGSFLENTYDILFHPRIALQRIVIEKPFIQALFLFFLSVIMPTAVTYAVLRNEQMQQIFALIIVGQMIISFIVWFCGAAILHLIAEFFGGKGTALGLLTALGFTHIPRLIAIPLLVLSAFLPKSGEAFVFVIVFITMICWSFFLDVEAIRANHKLSAVKSLLVLMVPLAAFIVSLIILVIAVGASVLMGEL